MENERKRILQLVQNGTISADEAIVLLEALSKQNESTQLPANPPVVSQESQPVKEDVSTQSHSSQEHHEYSETKNEQTKSKSSGFEDLFGNIFNNKESANQFVNELKQDLSQFSSRMMDVMNSTFSKVKDFDLEFPFGNKVEFDKTYSFDAAEIKGIELDIPNGRVDVVKAEDERFLIEAQIKTSAANQDEDLSKERFVQDFVTFINGKLTISTTTKMSQVNLRLVVPKQQYDVVLLRLLNGGVTIQNLDAKLLKVKTYNGAIKIDESTFQNADIQSGNGSIELRHVKGEDLEAETVNGRIYIDGDIQEVEAESVNGAVIVTTTSSSARKLKARTVAGAVEMYIPKTLSLNGQVSTNFGKTDVGLADIEKRSEEDQFLQKTLRFDKILENQPVLKLSGETRSGSIIVRYLA
ncbi:DUF4097 and DUF4098 domain-containing protein YvlB [Lysinibacillus composti]|uniref:Uncharacterized protein n=1 Tax=Lysinibacillus composti TaxID=720633 RepID=A0A3N9UIZ4_9BACI|nr:DUF4097 family beta strand repeat-containing protein [Lysinibacillus composti]MBM7607946.1 DUF4097 and DUF4098 domain-containing protein YvlB [Lysinibacillus composti]RQW75408.1 hypothetical protein EBB45_06590 [Lysinibacillus composti]